MIIILNSDLSALLCMKSSPTSIIHYKYMPGIKRASELRLTFNTSYRVKIVRILSPILHLIPVLILNSFDLKGDCGPNSLCKPNSNGVCVCPQGILGAKCDRIKSCPCINNGTCLSTFDTIPKCVCRHGFEGNLCQQKGLYFFLDKFWIKVCDCFCLINIYFLLNSFS